MMYTWSTQEENEYWGYGTSDSVEECFGEASDYLCLENVHGLYIGECVPYTEYGVDVESILEDISNDAYDYVGEVAECWLDSVTKEQVSELSKGLNAVFKKWLKENNLEPNFFLVENIKYVENPNDR